ncbi:5'-nucleotidase SurE [Planctomycetes bacterium Pan216]|uniref:5'-nucleotidase SurE n=1 Tax=Kolteria novifilia TaxID=2527975 RepID=A0A518B6E3_9BACT|nr:5'-nucleotidase SurE [Planctomycetes bacterium Pan216]
MRILLTNDDGIYAPGVRALRHALTELGEVTIVAPASEESAVGHSITLQNPLMVREVREQGEAVGFAVEGKPADCVKLGMVEILDHVPDLIVSGINAGSNAGINVHYSGTVAAAIEGAFLDVTSIAVSLELPEESHYGRAAQIAVGIIRDILANRPAKGELFNVNIPNLAAGDPLGVRIAELGLVCYRESYEARTDPRGRRYYWLLPDQLHPGDAHDSDLAGLAERYVTLTPLHFDLTKRERMASMNEWSWSPWAGENS